MSRSRKKKPSKPYRGYCTFPLVGADTYREFQEAAEMFGDFADPVKRKRIFDKPRKYRFEIWLKIHDKPEYEIREARITSEGVTRENLSQILYEVAMQGLRELDGLEEVDNTFKTRGRHGLPAPPEGD